MGSITRKAPYNGLSHFHTILSLVWQRLRPLGTFLNAAAFNFNISSLISRTFKSKYPSVYVTEFCLWLLLEASNLKYHPSLSFTNLRMHLYVYLEQYGTVAIILESSYWNSCSAIIFTSSAMVSMTIRSAVSTVTRCLAADLSARSRASLSRCSAWYSLITSSQIDLGRES